MARVLITSALPYVNFIPHLGNLIGAVLSADCYARHKRLQGHEVLFVCGADEHGTTTQIKAREEGLTPQQLCDKYGAIHKDIYDWFSISFDIWGRTHTDTHTHIVQDIFKKLFENGFIFEQEVEQLYDEQAKQFLSDRFVEGTCPHCDAPGARGDQCDACQRLINATELKQPVSKLTGSTPVRKKTTHFFIDLPNMRGHLEPWLERSSDTWTNNAITTTEQWIKDIKPRAITRDLDWGVPVPVPGYTHKVFYVWFDAPIGYISITAHERKDWESWWKNPDVELVQFMGKDNIVFHSVLFPSSLLGTDETWTLVDVINTTEFLNMERGKFSKSRNNGVFGDDCVRIEAEHGIPADVWRHYLLATRPETSDSTFSFRDFQARTNNELIATFGNLVHRTLSFAHQHPGTGTLGKEQHAFLNDGRTLAEDVIRALDTGSLKGGMQGIMRLAKHGNQYFQRREPWKTLATHPETAAADILALAHLVRDLSILVRPFLPTTSERIQAMLGTPALTYADLGTVQPELLKTLRAPEPLFTKLEDALIEKLERHFNPEMHTLDLRVAHIVEVKDHPKADKLYILDISLGKEHRQLVAGLKDVYTPEELRGRNVIIVANLQPAILRGEKSDGMLLASEAPDGTIGILTTDAKAGTALTIGGKHGMQDRISFGEFAALTFHADKHEITVEGEPVQGATITVDRKAYGRVR